MAYDVFISYSAKDKPTADAACSALEAAGVRCWVAPRDVVPGRSWAGSIVEAIGASRVMVLIFSSHSNSSQQVLREVERAVHKGVIIVPFRIEDVPPSADMEYYISTPHWLDALTPPLSAHLQRLCQTVSALVPRGRKEDPPKARAIPWAAAPPPTPSPRPIDWFRQPVVIGAAAVVAAAVVALLAILLFRRPNDQDLAAASKTATRSIEQPASSEKSPAVASTGERPGQNAGEKGSTAASGGQGSALAPTAAPATPKVAESASRREWQRSLNRSSQSHEQGAPRKLAFLVGVRTYQHSELKDLEYPENDIEDLAKLFNREGFTVTLLTTRAKPNDQDQFPTADNIRRQFAAVLSGASKHDLLVVGLAGHGLQPVSSPQSYFCPYDANPSERDGKLVKPESLLSIGEILEQLRESGIGQKLLLVDACRNDPQVHGGRRGGGVTQVDVATLPQQTGVLLSCAQGEFSFESKSFGNGHGAFFYEVIEGLNGAARDEDGEVTWESLRSFVRKRVPAKVRAVFGEEVGQQNPNEIGNLTGTPTVLAHVERARVEPPPSNAPSNSESVPPTVRMPVNPPLAADRNSPERGRDQPALLVAPFSLGHAVAARKAWAAHLQLAAVRKNSIDMPMVLIPPGQFAMGIEAGAIELAQTILQETPQHVVRISKPFYFGTCEVTKGHFQKFVDETHYKTGAERNHKGGFGYSAREKTRVHRTVYSWRNWGVLQVDTSPVVNVSWNDASRFCEWLSQKEGKRYRLPTEAEWEYACRAGTTSLYFNGNNPEELARVGNIADATARATFPASRFPEWAKAIGSSDGWAFTAPVGSFSPNNFGLFDMTGNVAEWCEDWFDPSYYAASPGADPPGPAEGTSRVIRGGGWSANPLQCRSASRWYGAPDDYLWDTGFRVVCTP